jgi:hypothetical protein
MHSVAIDTGTDDDGVPRFFVKLSGPDCELNLTLSESELDALRSVRGARWLARQSLAAGRCLGATAFWTCEDGRLSVLVGADDEVWEVCWSAPETIVKQLFQEIARARPK